MGGFVNTAVNMLKKLGTFACQYSSVLYQWAMKTQKIQIQRFRKLGIQKKVEKTYSGLGAEIFALYKEGQRDWAEASTVKEQLKIVEQAEASVFAIDQAVAGIQSEFQASKDAIAEKYASLRANIGQPEE